MFERSLRDGPPEGARPEGYKIEGGIISGNGEAPMTDHLVTLNVETETEDIRAVALSERCLPRGLLCLGAFRVHADPEPPAPRGADRPPHDCAAVDGQVPVALGDSLSVS